MSRALASPTQAVLDSIARFQSNVSVRAAEGAFVALSLGGFYLIAFLRLIDPFARDVTFDLLNTTPIAVQVGLTVIGPFAVVALEWLAALARLRQRDDAAEWTFDRRLRYLLKETSVDRTTAALVYMPLLPVAFFWAVVALLHQKPYWIVPAAIGLIDAAAIVAFNRYVT